LILTIGVFPASLISFIGWIKIYISKKNPDLLESGFLFILDQFADWDSYEALFHKPVGFFYELMFN
jgi:hypothetical protein